MFDVIRIIMMFLLIIIAMFIGALPLAKYLSKALDITIQDTFNTLILVANFIAIIVMIFTILFNNKSSKEQIIAMGDASNKQIETIRKTTQEHINKIEELDKKSKIALISAMVLEYKENFKQTNDILKGEKEYFDVDPKSNECPLSVFSFEAYQANLNNATIADPVLLESITTIYTTFKLYQGFVDIVKLNLSNKQFKIANLKRLISIIRANLGVTVRVQQQMVDYLASLRS